MEREVGGPGAQLSKRTSTLGSPVQLAASLNGTHKTPVSTFTVKRRLRDAGLQGRVAKKKPDLRLANKRKRLMGKITQTLDRGRLEKSVMDTCHTLWSQFPPTTGQ